MPPTLRSAVLRELEEKLHALLVRHHANDIDMIADPHARSEAHLLELAREGETNRLQGVLAARARNHLKLAQDERRATQPERSARHREKQMARVRAALAQTHGNRSAAARLLGCGRTTIDKYSALIEAEDRERPVDRCFWCRQPMPPMDGGRIA